MNVVFYFACEMGVSALSDFLKMCIGVMACCVCYHLLLSTLCLALPLLCLSEISGQPQPLMATVAANSTQ